MIKKISIPILSGMFLLASGAKAEIINLYCELSKDKHEQEELLELIQFYDKSEVKVQKMEEEVVVPAVIEEKVVKKADQKVKDPFIFITEPYRRDYSRLVYWCNPFEPINRGKLGSTQNWRIEKPIRSYY